MAENDRLWPEPVHMRSYLESWIAYVEAVEAQLARAIRQHEETTAQAATTIKDLRAKIETMEAPYKAEIEKLTHQIVELKASIQVLENGEKDTIERLARVLELTSTRGVSRLSVISQTIVLAEEAKKIIRGNL